MLRLVIFAAHRLHAWNQGLCYLTHIVSAVTWKCHYHLILLKLGSWVWVNTGSRWQRWGWNPNMSSTSRLFMGPAFLTRCLYVSVTRLISKTWILHSMSCYFLYFTLGSQTKSVLPCGSLHLLVYCWEPLFFTLFTLYIDCLLSLWLQVRHLHLWEAIPHHPI